MIRFCVKYRMFELTVCCKVNITVYFQVLAWANKNGNCLLPVYCFDPRHYSGTYKFGFPKTGAHRLKFLLESVKDLRSTLKSHGR
jgi:hypothetical protein